VNASEARELQDALSMRVPGGEVAVAADPDGARIVIEVDGRSHRYNVGNPPSALLNQLLTGRAN
jgi:hypothetical protein